jgi:hypothetical protein
MTKIIAGDNIQASTTPGMATCPVRREEVIPERLPVLSPLESAAAGGRMLIGLAVGWFGYLVLVSLLRDWGRRGAVKASDLKVAKMLGFVFLAGLLVFTMVGVVVLVTD